MNTTNRSVPNTECRSCFISSPSSSPLRQGEIENEEGGVTGQDRVRNLRNSLQRCLAVSTSREFVNIGSLVSRDDLCAFLTLMMVGVPALDPMSNNTLSDGSRDVSEEVEEEKEVLRALHTLRIEVALTILTKDGGSLEDTV